MTLYSHWAITSNKTLFGAIHVHRDSAGSLPPRRCSGAHALWAQNRRILKKTELFFPFLFGIEGEWAMCWNTVSSSLNTSRPRPAKKCCSSKFLKPNQRDGCQRCCYICAGVKAAPRCIFIISFQLLTHSDIQHVKPQEKDDYWFVVCDTRYLDPYQTTKPLYCFFKPHSGSQREWCQFT